MAQSGYGAYQRIQAETSSPAQLITLLYDGLLKRLQRASQGLEARDLEEANGSLVRAQEILLELVASLDMESGEIAENLSQLYEYQHHRLVEANLRKDVDAVAEVAAIASQVREAWIYATQQVAIADLTPLDEDGAPRD